MRTITRLLGALMLALGLPLDAAACATCFGRSDSPLAEGMNMGILVLLGVVFAVLAGLTTFFVFLARRAAAVGGAAGGDPLSPPQSCKS